LLYSRRWANDHRTSVPQPVPQAIAVGIALAFARAVKDRGTLQLSEREFRMSGIHTCQWRMRVDWEGRLRPMFDPVMFCVTPPIGGPSDVDLISPEMVQPEQVPHRGASDVFQVAAFLGLLLRDDGMFGSNPQQIVERVSAPEPLSLEELVPLADTKLREVLAQALARDPARRTQTVEALAEQLRAFGDEEPAALWLRDELVRLHSDELRHQERAFAELSGVGPEPIPPELEARVMAARGDESAWLVLCDWLNANGLPRGELAIQHHRDRGAKVVKHDELTRRERDALVEIDRYYWLYDLDAYFHYGYADSIAHVEERSRNVRRRPNRPDYEPPRFPDSVERSLFQALSLPTFRFLRAVLVDTNCEELDAVVRALAASGHPGVEDVFVPYERVVDVSETLRPRLPRLKRVRSCSESSEEARRALLATGS
jgi:hypothetical protein